MTLDDYKREQQKVALQALILADRPVPEYLFYGTHGSRSTFSRWEMEGLAIHRKGHGRFVRPSELDAFLTAKRQRKP